MKSLRPLVLVLLGSLQHLFGQNPVGPTVQSPPEEQPPAYRMGQEQSPYLRQHAQDAVGWYPWGPEALKKAEAESKPIFLSIGYAACHWCHVMQRESFQDADVGRLLNTSFVPIKIDREERPDLDRIYMSACIAIHQRGGWPLSVLLTPDRRPFWAGTYFPKDRFLRILEYTKDQWRDRRGTMELQAKSLTESLAAQHAAEAKRDFPADLGSFAAKSMLRNEDRVHGGFGRAPKFPQPSSSLLLLREAFRSGESSYTQAVRRQLDAMMNGGIYDHLAGGFHRYSTDAEWKVPHFEKMLYDQAMISQLYLAGYVATRDENYARIVRETLWFCLRELKTTDGTFISALDADTEHEEGLTYVWTLGELESHLSKEELLVLATWCGATRDGNWEHGRNILYEHADAASVERALDGKIEPSEVGPLLARAKVKLLAARAKKPQPARDTKVLTEWNALMASALVQAGRVLKEPGFVDAGVTCALALESRQKTKTGLYQRSHAGGRSRHAGELADHGALLEAFLDIYETNLDVAWLDRSKALAKVIDATFAQPDGGFVDSVESDLIFRTRDLFDSAHPAGFSLVVNGLIRLGVITGEESWRDRATRALASAATSLASGPLAAPHALLGLDLLQRPAPRVELHGTPETVIEASVREWITSLPLHVVSITRQRPTSDGPFQAIVCVGTTCLEPAKSLEELRARIATALK